MKIDYTRDYHGELPRRRTVGIQPQLTRDDPSHGRTGPQPYYVKLQDSGTGPGGRVLAKGEVDPRGQLLESLSRSPPAHTLLGVKWHAFYDNRGRRVTMGGPWGWSY